MTSGARAKAVRIATEESNVRSSYASFAFGGALKAAVGPFTAWEALRDIHGARLRPVGADRTAAAPRPSAPFPLQTGLVGTDRDAAANGVTTAWMAQSWSWEGGHRGPDYAERFFAAHAAYRTPMQTDLRIQVRCETPTMDTQDRLIAAVDDYGIDYVIFNNHLDEAVALAAAGDPATMAAVAAEPPAAAAAVGPGSDAAGEAGDTAVVAARGGVAAAMRAA